MPLKGDMTFGVWDPTLYTSMDFASDKDILVEGAGFKACQHKVVRPNPDEVIAQNQKTLTPGLLQRPDGDDHVEALRNADRRDMLTAQNARRLA